MLVEQLTRSKFIHNKEKAALRKMTTVKANPHILFSTVSILL